MKKILNLFFIINFFVACACAESINPKDLLEKEAYKRIEILRVPANNQLDNDFRSGVYIDDGENVYVSYNFIPKIEVYKSGNLITTIKWKKDNRVISANVRYYIKINHEGFIMVFPESSGFKTHLFDKVGNEIGLIEKSKRYEKCEFNGNEIYDKKTGNDLYKIDLFKNNSKKVNGFQIQTNDNGDVTKVIIKENTSFTPKTYLDYSFSDIVAIDDFGNIYCGYVSKPAVVGNKYTGEMVQKLGVLKINSQLNPLEFFEGSQIINEKNGFIYTIEQNNGEIIVYKWELK